MDDFQLLDQARQAYLDAKAAIERLRQKIAEDACPIVVGSHITIERDGKQYEGIVGSIGPAMTHDEFLSPVVGAPAGWSVQGSKINKDGAVSKHGFGFSSFEAVKTDRKWLVTPQTIESLLGL